ncbi:MAG: hypothetical protein JWO86_4059 [Myxococcaceae bacterium]|nr:hypothetical protein [Myxococcaceae bacterium]
MSDKWRERKELARQAWRRLRGGELTPWRAALSVGLGLVIGMTPAFGLHWLIVIAVCVPLRLDTGVAYLAANISMPLIAPFITFAEIEMGALLLHGHFMAMSPSDIKATGIGTLVAELVVGTLVVAPAGGAVGGSLAYAFVAWRRRKRATA